MEEAAAPSSASDSDAIFSYDESAQAEFQNEKPWANDRHYLQWLRISALALLKMVVHALSGWTIVVMELIQGKTDSDFIILMDAFAFPVEGTKTRAGRQENVVGWYHSRPGYGCRFSGIDVSTQMAKQQADNQLARSGFGPLIAPPQRKKKVIIVLMALLLVEVVNGRPAPSPASGPQPASTISTSADSVHLINEFYHGRPYSTTLVAAIILGGLAFILIIILVAICMSVMCTATSPPSPASPPPSPEQSSTSLPPLPVRIVERPLYLFSPRQIYVGVEPPERQEMETAPPHSS